MHYLHLDEVDSTNSYLKKHCHTLPNWTILTTNKQTSGRGRLDHTWESNPNENLICSILIKDKKILSSHECLVLLVGVALYHLLTNLGIKNVKIKRPNDIYVGKDKICGILLESISTSENLDALIIGIGLNLNQITFSSNLNATSYRLLTNKEIDINKVKIDLVNIIQEEVKKINGNNYNNVLLKKYHRVICERI